ncbi:hypothetical protein SAMN02949497_1252 [Methylomagnum ishizawai]|uniref:Uncharacterized protein n=1 Tax=Methylomagnum ishizawai TaxID=1760988 RepID=A0A1Y6CUI3_9GAMM|nr:hypothetical protein [Methylomagnum ishizawai]SMF93956.1 hypothetical protein SAMN02949497_1252 [Methylomagnum ishizawai]
MASKKDELLALVGRYYDGVSVKTALEKLPKSWFTTSDPKKEVANCLQVLRREGLIESREIENSGVFNWFKVDSAPASNPHEAPDGPGDIGTDAVMVGAAEGTADAGAGADTSAPENGVDDSIPTVEESLPPVPLGAVAKFAALALEAELKHDGPAVEFRETAIPAERFVLGPRPPRIEGIDWVWAARTEDGQLFEDTDAAIEHRDSVRLDRLIAEFVEECGPTTHGVVEGIRVWEEFKRSHVGSIGGATL